MVTTRTTTVKEAYDDNVYGNPSPVPIGKGKANALKTGVGLLPVEKRGAKQTVYQATAIEDEVLALQTLTPGDRKLIEHERAKAEHEQSARAQAEADEAARLAAETLLR